MLVLVCVMLLVPATIAAVYYFTLTAIGWHRVRHGLATPPRTRFVILVPAHDEELCLSHTLATIRESDYPAELLRVLVVADNCTDRTATVARSAGFECLERHDLMRRGKGFALSLGLPHALTDSPDAVLILDADCRLDRFALRRLSQELERGAEAVQAAVVLGDPNAGASGLVMAVGSTIENGLQAGQSRLGSSVRLRGTGMAFRREVLEHCPWTAFGLTEDAEYAATLREAGVRVRFVPEAVVTNSPPVGVEALCRQRERWRDALFVSGTGLRERLLASKPLVLAQLVATACVVFGASAWVPSGFVIWVGVLLAMTACVYLRALRRCGTSMRAVAGLWRTPLIVARLAWVTLGGFVSRAGTWERTERMATHS